MSLHGLPVQETERYVTAKELAALMGVSLSTIKTLTKEGMPSVVWGKRARRYRPSVAMAWARDAGRDRQPS